MRTITASWAGDPQNPEMMSNRKVWVSDPKQDALTELRISEAERLHGLKEGP